MLTADKLESYIIDFEETYRNVPSKIMLHDINYKELCDDLVGSLEFSTVINIESFQGIKLYRWDCNLNEAQLVSVCDQFSESYTIDESEINLNFNLRGKIPTTKDLKDIESYLNSKGLSVLGKL